jgi:hypothetical protein
VRNQGGYLAPLEDQADNELPGEGRDPQQDYMAPHNQAKYSNYGAPNQTAVEVLMVAEKPSISRTIVEALSGGKYTTRKGTPLYIPRRGQVLSRV